MSIITRITSINILIYMYFNVMLKQKQINKQNEQHNTLKTKQTNKNVIYYGLIIGNG
jgi:hypothetical protein